MRLLNTELRRRLEDGAFVDEAFSLNPTETAVIVVDMWDYHWCKTWVGRAGAMIPKMNRALAALRRIGVKVIHAPTNFSASFSGAPQREAMLAFPDAPGPAGVALNEFPLDERLDLLRTDIPGLRKWPGEMCNNPYPCQPNYSGYSLDARVYIAPEDFISANGQEVYNFARHFGIQNLLYMGGATNLCLLIKPEAIVNMSAAGFRCIVARDICEAHSHAKDSAGLDAHSEEAVAYIEQYFGCSMAVKPTLEKAGLLDPDEVDECVLVQPWGSLRYPQYFDDRISVTLSAPYLPGAEIRYTLDGSAPRADSKRYEGRFEIRATSVLQTAAFRDGRQVSLCGESHYRQMPPIPPRPDVFLSDLEPLWQSMRGYVAYWNYREPTAKAPPARDLTFDRQPLVSRGVAYAKGMGVDSPSQLVYAIEPGYGRFVARGAVCESLLNVDLGADEACFAELRFKVFIDGVLMAESLMLHISEEAWRFDVPIPEGSRKISLVTTPSREGRRCDLANWIDAGFVLR